MRIEDFIDTEFDFEANLALFDKQAFYNETDKKAAANEKNGSCLRQLIPEGEQILVEGPDKIGFETVSRKLVFFTQLRTPWVYFQPEISILSFFFCSCYEEQDVYTEQVA